MFRYSDPKVKSSHSVYQFSPLWSATWPNTDTRVTCADTDICETQWPWPPLFSPSWLIQWRMREGSYITLFSPGDVTAFHRIRFTVKTTAHSLIWAVTEIRFMVKTTAQRAIWYANGVHLSAIWKNSALIPRIRCEPLDKHFIPGTCAVFSHIARKMNNVFFSHTTKSHMT